MPWRSIWDIRKGSGLLVEAISYFKTYQLNCMLEYPTYRCWILIKHKVFRNKQLLNYIFLLPVCSCNLKNDTEEQHLFTDFACLLWSYGSSKSTSILMLVFLKCQSLPAYQEQENSHAKRYYGCRGKGVMKFLSISKCLCGNIAQWD